MVTREDLDALVDSVEILSNPKTMEALRKSDQDIKAGRVKEVTSVNDLLAEL
jgi:antitoxin YefM